MRRSSLAALALWLIANSGQAEDKRPKPAPAPPPAPTADACTHVRGSVRQEAFGYTHVVMVHNGCAKPVSCQVWSSVDPDERVSVNLAPNEATEVITRRGSPAYAVTGLKKCSFR